jgi:hypothetical protein
MKRQSRRRYRGAKYQEQEEEDSMIFLLPGNTKYNVAKSLERFGGVHRNYQFVEHGLTTWTA